MAFGGAFLAVLAAALLLAPSVLGRSMDAPLPPVAVTATTTDAGVVVKWLPPPDDGGHPINTYSIHRLQDDGFGWDKIGTVDAQKTSFTDTLPQTGAVEVYYVMAYNEAGSSPQSEPASTGQLNAMCNPVIIEGSDVGLNKNCLPFKIEILYLGD